MLQAAHMNVMFLINDYSSQQQPDSLTASEYHATTDAIHCFLVPVGTSDW
jgi:hypothetical protein